jgi:DNA-binding CsgD family transcriptional regulator
MNDTAPRRQQPRDSGLGAAPALTPVTSLGERLRSERQRAFVGRASELATFKSLLVDASHSLLFIKGQVGVGKSALLQEYLRVALASGHCAVLLDAQQLSGDANASRAAISSLEGGRGTTAGARGVLLIDGFDGSRSDHEWVLAELAPALAADVLLVLASRMPAPASLWLDPAWSRLLLQRELQPLARSEATRLLELRHVPEAAYNEVLEFASGFPLALAVAAEAVASSGDEGFTLDRLQEVQHRLGRVLCPVAVTSGQQLALDVCALARTTTAELLDLVRRSTPLEHANDTSDAFDWLAHQSFVEWTPSGLRPHSLLRTALEARLRRERPRRHRAILQALRDSTVVELTTNVATGPALADLFFLDRDVPRVRRWAPPPAPQPLKSLEVAQPSDHREIVELIRRAEGDEAAALAAAMSGPDFEIVRGKGIEGLLQFTRLDAESGSEKLPSKDPVSALVRRYMAEHPLEAGEQALLCRWFLDAQDYQTPSWRVLAVTGRQTQIVLGAERLPYSFCINRTPGEWISLWTDIGLPWQIVDRFRLGAHDYSLLVFDWKRRPLRDVLVQASHPTDAQAAGREQASTFDELRVKVGERVANLARKINLTPREVEILEQLCLGHSLEEVAKKLSIRPRTVKFHQENLLRKTGASSRIELFRKLL